MPFVQLKPKPDWESNLQYLLYIIKNTLLFTINLTSASTMTMASFFRSSLLMFKEMLFPNDSSSFKLENLLRFLLFLILTPVAIFGTLALMFVVGSGVALLQLVAILMENSLANNLVMTVAFINHVLLACKKMLLTTFTTFFTARKSKGAGKAKAWVSSDSGIDSPNISEADNDEFAEPHDAWVKELGTGAYEPDFEEKNETLYLVFWYYICNNFLM